MKEFSVVGSIIVEDDSSSVCNGSVVIDGNFFDILVWELEEEFLVEKENDLVRLEIDVWSKVEILFLKKDDDWLMYNGIEKFIKLFEIFVDV